MTLIIEDLELDAELDKEAMMAILGGRKSSRGGSALNSLAGKNCFLNQKIEFTFFNKQLRNRYRLQT